MKGEPAKRDPGSSKRPHREPALCLWGFSPEGKPCGLPLKSRWCFAVCYQPPLGGCVSRRAGKILLLFIYQPGCISEGLWSGRSGGAAWMGGGRGSCRPTQATWEFAGESRCFPQTCWLRSAECGGRPRSTSPVSVWGGWAMPFRTSAHSQPAAHAFPTIELSRFQDQCPKVHIFSINADLHVKFQIEKTMNFKFYSMRYFICIV